MVSDLVCGPGDLPVSTLTRIEPALPGWRTFGKPTAVQPQLGTTDSMFRAALPLFLIRMVRVSVLSCGCLPKSRSFSFVRTASFGPLVGAGAAAVAGVAATTGGGDAGCGAGAGT